MLYLGIDVVLLCLAKKSAQKGCVVVGSHLWIRAQTRAHKRLTMMFFGRGACVVRAPQTTRPYSAPLAADRAPGDGSRVNSSREDFEASSEIQG